jgi:hypothetical protein
MTDQPDLFPSTDPDLSAMICHGCHAPGVTIVVFGALLTGSGSNDNGGMERWWCGHVCAMAEGWPFLKSEKGRR